MSLKPSKSARQIVEEISRVVQSNPNISRAFNTKSDFDKTLQNIIRIDEEFQQRGGVFFQRGGNAFETAQEFTRLHVEEYRKNGRPSLPALAVEYAERLKLGKDSPEYKALILVSARAELIQAINPDYHNKFHYVDVTAVAINLVEKNNEMAASGLSGAVPLTPTEQALVVVAAIGHDLDHPGCGNPKEDIYKNEKSSFEKIKPLLREAGLPDKNISKVEIMLLTTSPNGPHAILKQIAARQRLGEVIDWTRIDPHEKFPELKPLAADAKLIQSAAILSDADLYASGGAGFKSNKVMSELLTAESRASGINMDFTTNKARQFFLDHIMGKEGFASNAGREMANDVFTRLRAETEQRLTAQSGPSIV